MYLLLLIVCLILILPLLLFLPPLPLYSQLTRDQALLQRLSRNAIQSARRRFSADKFRERYTALYRGVWENVTVV
jgi:hypothetical protein